MVGWRIAHGGVVLSELRPFFTYFGGKWRMAPLFPEPKHATIVEPFAGSAGYSLRYSDRNVVIADRDPIIAEVWRYLIRVYPDEVLALPDLADDQTVEDLRVCQEAKWLIGFWLNLACASPRKQLSSWGKARHRPDSFWGQAVRRRIATQLDRIRHWKVYNCSFDEVPVSGAATWFIDPPYQVAGKAYRFGSKVLDFDALAAWCRSRQGQVMVCENEGAQWLPFEFLATTKTQRSKRSAEVWWTNEGKP